MNNESFIQRTKRALRRPEGKFVLTFLSTFIISSFVLVALAIIVDPHEDFGTGIFKPLVLTNRTQKLEMIDALKNKPQILVLGSSRVFTMDPDLIEEVTGKSAFNAAVSYGRPEDYNAIIRYLILEKEVIPETIIVGFNAGAFNSDPIERQLQNNKLLNKYLDEDIPPPFTQYTKILKEKLNAAYIRDIARGIFFNTKGYPQDQVMFFPNGRQDTSDNPYSDEKMLKNYYRAYNLFSDIDEPLWDRLEYFRSFVRFTFDYDIEIKVVLLPMPEIVREKLEKETNIIAVEDSLRSFLTDEMPDVVKFYDFSKVENFDGEQENFNDPTHPGIININLITRKLFE